jgi:hypothetical protein
VGQLRVPQPYDFERSLDRFTFWGVDRANVWHHGGLHRVIEGREVRIAPLNGGVHVEPFDEVIEPAVRRLLGLDLDLESFCAFAHGEPVLADLVRRFPGYRPPLAPDPFEALVSSITAQQVSLHAAFAVRSRFIERFGVRGEARSARPRSGPGEGVRGNREVPPTSAKVLAFPGYRGGRPSTCSAWPAPSSTSTSSCCCPTPK